MLRLNSQDLLRAGQSRPQHAVPRARELKYSQYHWSGAPFRQRINRQGHSQTQVRCWAGLGVLGAGCLKQLSLPLLAQFSDSALLPAVPRPRSVPADHPNQTATDLQPARPPAPLQRHGWPPSCQWQHRRQRRSSTSSRGPPGRTPAAAMAPRRPRRTGRSARSAGGASLRGRTIPRSYCWSCSA